MTNYMPYKNKDKQREYQRIYHKEYDKKKETYKKWKSTHIEYEREKNREKYKNNKKYYQEYLKEWRKNNKDKVFKYRKDRRLLKLFSCGSHTYLEWVELKKEYNYTCPCCGRQEPEILLTRDHIVPLSIGGSDKIENIQPLCQSCNSKKSTKTIKYKKLVASVR